MSNKEKQMRKIFVVEPNYKEKGKTDLQGFEPW